MTRAAKLTPAMLTLLAILVVGGGCPAIATPGGDVPTLSLERTESFVRRVTAEGYLRAVEATPLTAPTESQRPMRIAWVAPDGSRVKEGEVVVRFDFAEMQRQLEDSRDDVGSAEREITKEKAERSAARSKRDRTAEQSEREVVTAREFELDEDAKILSRNDIIETKLDVELATAKAEHARSVKKVEHEVSNSKLGLLDITKNQAVSELERAKEGLANLEVKAPHDGILVLRRDWMGNRLRVGDTVWRGQKLAELPLVTDMEAELFVLEADAGDLAVDQAAEVVVEAHSARPYPAKIKRIDTLAKPRHQEVPVQYFAVTLSFEATDPETMKVGQRVRATISIEQEDVIIVPRQAVFDRDAKHVVHRKTASGFEPVEVELGSSSAGRVVIVSGLEAGDEIALRDPDKAVGAVSSGTAGDAAPDQTPGPGAEG